MSRNFVLVLLVGAVSFLVIGSSYLPIGQHTPAAVAAVAAPTPENYSGCKPCLRPNEGTPNKPANVTDITLDKTEVRQPCPGAETNEPAGSKVEAEVTAEDPENDILTYNYVISGGRIVGTGKKVVWDLTKATAGTYSITAGVDDGCGICGKTMTKLVKIEVCTSTE